MKKNCKRGFTLAELSVVLAVIAIVSTVIISVTAMVTQRSKISRAHLDALQDIELIETFVESYIEGTENPDIASIKVEEDEGENKKALFIDGEKKLALGTVVSVGVTTYLNENNADTLYVCKITYHIPYEKENTVHTYTFCVNPYVGETVTKTPGGETVTTPTDEEEGV